MTLYLIPTLISEESSIEKSLPPYVNEVLDKIDGFFVETPKLARAFLKRFNFDRFRDLPMVQVNKRTETSEIDELMQPLKDGKKWAVLSDAGTPCIADPGQKLVAYARDNNIGVEAIIGPSSILQSLIISGLPAQRFFFHGYLPKGFKRHDLEEGMTHLFIETPFRNQAAMRLLTGVLKDDDRMAVCTHLMSSNERVDLKSIENWKRVAPEIYFPDKVPTMFLVYLRKNEFRRQFKKR